MQPSIHSQEGTQSVGGRIGFWLGLALFVTLLLIPTPDSMRRAVRERFAADIQADVQRALARPSLAAARQDNHAVPAETSLATDSDEYRRAETQAVEDRARVILAAAAVSALVACWWITVAVPIPVTSLLPLLLFPLVGVLSIDEAAIPYANPNVYLFMGGFIIALSIERWGLHRRIALHIVLVIGRSRATIVLGFMLASAFLSMWISNTATTLMMLPIGMAIISALTELTDEDNPLQRENFSAALMLGIAYAASIGGVATPIGTPPNIAFQGQYHELFPDAPQISFGQWVTAYLPLVVLFIPVVWLVLVRITCPVQRGRLHVGREVIREDLRRLGPMDRPELTVLIVFVATALLWMTRSIPVGEHNYGWAALVERWLTGGGQRASLFNAGYVSDASVALGMAVLLFVLPAGRGGTAGREPLMNWETAQKLPWGILLLFGGGFSVAAGFKASGLSYWCGMLFADTGITNPLLVVLCTCLLMTFLTEVTSNTATTQVMLPILARVSHAIGVNPLMLMLPATISASCAFMLPVATPPNAIVFGSGCIKMNRMVRTGIILNFIGVILVTATFYVFVRPMLGISLTAASD